ncbi:UNVERIFIED_ORG: hypothetical protein J2791_006297 [Burkholderia contaminans]|nr:hypothetical protein [Burkholderia contaminans]
MAHAICETHGSQPAELVTRNVLDMIRSGVKPAAGRVFPITLVYEELEYPGYGMAEDLSVLRGMGGIWESVEMCRFTDEQAMEKAIGLFTAVCAKCLAEVL